jgi:caffeoyl-CoA O-methyltransferase
LAGPKSFFLSGELHEYVVGHGTAPDPVLEELAEITRRETGGLSAMQVAPEQGAFMQLIAQAIGAKHAVEVGTFTGYSALCIARGLPDDGTLLCCDISEEWTSLGKPYWERAGVAGKIELHIGPAIDTLRALPEQEQFDIAFIDADKPSYGDYFEALLPRIRRGGLILVDNVLWGGNVLNPDASDENTLAIRAFNDRVRDDPRVDCVMLTISDGLTLLRKH